MARQFFAFDLETTELAPDRGTGRVAPISCSAIALAGGGTETHFLPADEPACYGGDGAMTPEGAARVVRRLEQLVGAGGVLVTWNGAGFDLPVLARASGLHAECARLALGSVALEGMGLPGKTGDGVEAVGLWREGRHREVLDYCAADAAGTLGLALAGDGGTLRWRSTRGVPQSLVLRDGWLTVEQCLALPEPDTSWMDTPLTRTDLVGWCTGASAPTLAAPPVAAAAG